MWTAEGSLPGSESSELFQGFSMTLWSWGNEGVPRCGTLCSCRPRPWRPSAPGPTEGSACSENLNVMCWKEPASCPPQGWFAYTSLVWFAQAPCKSPADVLKLVRFQGGKNLDFQFLLKPLQIPPLSCRVRLQTWVTRGRSLPEGSVTPCGGVSWRRVMARGEYGEENRPCGLRNR